MIEIEINIDRLIRFLIYTVVMIACGVVYLIFNHLIMVQVVVLIIVASINAYLGYYCGVMDLAEEVGNALDELEDEYKDN